MYQNPFKKKKKKACPDFTVIYALSSEVPLSFTYKDHPASLANSHTLGHKNHLEFWLKMEIPGSCLQRISFIDLSGAQKSEFLSFWNPEAFIGC